MTPQQREKQGDGETGSSEIRGLEPLIFTAPRLPASLLNSLSRARYRHCPKPQARGSFARMSRWAAACLISCIACADNPYVIGRLDHDAAVEADASVDPCLGALVCAGFEEELANDWPDTIVDGMASIESSAAQAHSGKRALHAMSSGPMSRAVVVRDFPAQEAGELYLRAWL